MLAGGALAEPVEPPPIAAPAVLAAGQGDWLWILWLGPESSPQSGGRPTQLVARQVGQDWRRVQYKQMPQVLLAAARGDRLDAVLPDGSHYLYRPDGGQVRMASLPAGAEPIALAADGDRLFAVAARAPSPGSQPDTMPDRGPPPRTLHLLVQENGPWSELAALPTTADLPWADHLSLAVHLGRPVVLATVDGRLVCAEWAARVGGEGWQVRPVRLASGVERIEELKALSVNKRLYVVGWTGASGVGPFVARVEHPSGEGPGDLLLADCHDLAGLSPSLDLRTRYRRWDLAGCGDRLVVVREDPDGPGLQVRRYDPQTQTWDGPFTPVIGMGQSADWVTDLFHSPLFVSVLLGILVMVFVIRRPGGVIRLPIDVEPGRLRSRLLALLIDAAPCAAASVLLIYGADLSAARRDLDNLLFAGVVNRVTIGPVALWLGLLVVYGTVAETLFAATLGKRLCGLSVYSVKGVRPGLGQALLRNVLKVVDVPLCPIVLLLVTLHPARQRIGDLLAGTIVVGPRRTPLPPWVRQFPGPDAPPEDDDQPPSSPS